jgi:hypothetical protein
VLVRSGYGLSAPIRNACLKVKESLARTRSRITLSFDAWSSPKHYSLLGVVGH